MTWKNDYIHDSRWANLVAPTRTVVYQQGAGATAGSTSTTSGSMPTGTTGALITRPPITTSTAGTGAILVSGAGATGATATTPTGTTAVPPAGVPLPPVYGTPIPTIPPPSAPPMVTGGAPIDTTGGGGTEPAPSGDGSSVEQPKMVSNMWLYVFAAAAVGGLFLLGDKPTA